MDSSFSFGAIRALLVSSLLVGFMALAAGAAPQVAEARACGTTKQRVDDGTVYAMRVRAKRAPCRGARRLARHLYGRIGTRRHGGPSNAEAYYTLKAFPGWRCGIGAGGAGCKKRGGRRISIEVFID